MILFFLFSYSALLVAFFSSRFNNLRIFAILFFALASFFRGGWGPDYTTYLFIYNGVSEIGDSGSYLFDLFLRFTAYCSLDYQYVGVLTKLICFSWLLWMPRYPKSSILFLNSSFYSFFFLFSANINKTHLMLSIFAGVVLPIIVFLNRQSLSRGARNLSFIMLILFCLICFFLQPAVAVFLLIVLTLYYLVDLFIVTVRLLALSKFSLLLFIKLLFVSIILFLPLPILLFSNRFSYYFISLLDPSSDYYNATQNSSALFHFLPFIVFPVILFLLFYPFSFNRAFTCHPPYVRSFSSWVRFCFPISFSFYIVALFYIYCSISGANPNLVGRTSIVYTLLVVYFSVTQLPMVGPLSFRANFLILISCFLPLFLRAFSALNYGLSL